MLWSFYDFFINSHKICAFKCFETKIVYKIISIIIYYLIKTNPTLFSNVPEKLAFVLGFYNNSYSSIDHFSIFPWIIITLLGINIGYIIKDNKPELPRFIKNNFRLISLFSYYQNLRELYRFKRNNLFLHSKSNI